VRERPPLTNPALEAAILEAPLDPAPRSIYGDWLESEGDLRGPWFALSAAVEAAPLDVRLRSAATEYFHEHGRAFLGHGIALRSGTWYGWLGGFLDEIRMQPFAGLKNAVPAAAALFAHPHTRFLRHVALGNIPELEDVIAGLAAADLPLLETVTLIDGPSQGRTVYVIDDLVKRPSLRRLGIRKATWSVPAPHVRELWLEYNERDDATLGLIRKTTPNLEELTIDCRAESPLMEEVVKLLGDLPALRRLRVLHATEVTRLIRELTPPPPNLELLDISHSSADQVTVERFATWPVGCELIALRTRIPQSAAERLRESGHKITSSFPTLRAFARLRDDTGPDSWYVHRAKTEGRDVLRIVPNAGAQLFDSAVRNLESRDYDPVLMDHCVTLPSERWHVWPWASAASARSWRREYALCEAIAREGLMREPREPNFYAFITYAMRRQGLYAEAADEVPRAERALAKPPREAQEDGPALCLIDCMLTLAQVDRYADALSLSDRLSKYDDPNIQALRAMCHAHAGDHAAAREAIRRAGVGVETAPGYVREPARRAVYDHALAVAALLLQLPEDLGRDTLLGPGPPDIAGALAALRRAWPVYPEREWFKRDPNLAALHDHPDFKALVG
jgi:uncharacterized protein (TIGR02996 family)